MFGLGMGEIVLLGGIGVLLFGGKKLPELGSALGKAITNFKKGLGEGINNEEDPQDPAEVKKRLEKKDQ